ncbi:MAG: FecR family protein [Woeseia sp.]
MRIPGNTVFRCSQLVLCCTLLLLITAVRAQAQDVTDKLADGLIVEETDGAVKIKLDNQWQSPNTGMVVGLPATVSTGADGAIKLRQGATIISIAANTAVELFEGPEPGSPLQRVVQNQGSAFYDIAPRGSNKLRVETPYLVAVIKGTQFNVTVASETSTVALFEGRLQIEAPDIGDVVDLHEGQIAKRHRDDAGITVLSMQDSEPVSRSDAAPESDLTDGDDRQNASNAGNSDSIAIDDSNVLNGDDVVVRVDGADNGGAAGPGFGTDAQLEPDQGLPGIKTGADALTVDLDGDLDLGPVDAGLNAAVDIGSGNIDLELDTGLDLGAAGVDVGLDVGADLGAGDIDLGLDSGLDLGDNGVDVGLDAGLDLGEGDIDVGLDAGLDLGDTVVDTGLDAGVDLGGGALDVGLDTGLDLGDTAVDVGLDAGVDLDSGDAAVGVDTGVDLGVAGVDLGVDIDLGDLGDLVDIDLGLDLLDGEDTDSDTTDDEGDVLPIDPGDLFDLLGL